MDTSRIFGGLTNIGRPVDLSRASNRLAVAATGLGAVVGAVLTLVLTEASVLGAIGAGLAYGVGAFLTWAVGRELDPGDASGARFALFAYAVVAVAGPPELLTVVAALLAVRIVARTTGRAPSPADLAAAVVVAGLAATTSTGFVTAVALAAALWLDVRMDRDPDMVPQVAAAGLALAGAFVVTLVSGAFLSGWRGPTPLEATIVVVAAGAAGRMRANADVRADLTREPLDPVRVRRALQLAAATAGVAVLWSGFDAVAAAGPVLAGLVGSGAAAWRRGRRRVRSG